MQGNYRHHYLLSSSEQASANPTSNRKPSSHQHPQQRQVLPAGANYSGLAGATSNAQAAKLQPEIYQHQAYEQNSSQPARSHFVSQQQQQFFIQRQMTNNQAASRVDFCQASHRDPRHGAHFAHSQHQQMFQAKQQFAARNEQVNGLADEDDHDLEQQQQFASQLRKSQQHRFHQDPATGNQFAAVSTQNFRAPIKSAPQHSLEHQSASGSSSASSSPQSINAKPNEQYQSRRGSQSGSSAPSRDSLHVNFNRPKPNSHNSQRASDNKGAGDDDDDDDEGENSRKKKYLTAKYGQQQMNLIKKRLKVEMWLHEQLQELAKGSKSEVSETNS